MKADVEQNCVTVLKEIVFSSHRCFIPLPIALFHGVMCVFRTPKDKSNDLYLLVMAQCNGRMRRSTRQTLGTSPQCALHREQENTDISQHTSLRKTCIDKNLVDFKENWSISNHELDGLCRFSVMQRQQLCWKFACGRRNFGTSSQFHQLSPHILFTIPPTLPHTSSSQFHQLSPHFLFTIPPTLPTLPLHKSTNSPPHFLFTIPPTLPKYHTCNTDC